MKKRVLSLVCIFALLMLTITACSGGGSPGTQEPAPPANNEPSTPAQGGSEPAGGETVADLLAMDWADIEAQAKQEGEVVFAVWGDEAEWNQMGKLFQEQYGIKLTLVVGEKVNVMNKAISELNSKGSMDVMMLAGETVNGLINAGALTPNILDKMEHKDKLVEGLSQRKEGVSNEKGYWVPICVNPSGFVYNTKNIENPPMSFAEFEAYIDANPLKFGFCLPEKGGTGQSMMESIIANLTGGLDQYLLDPEVDPEKHAKWDVVWEWVNARKDKITFTNSNSDSVTRMNSGELDLIVAWNSNLNVSLDSGELFQHYGFYVPDFGLCYSGEVLSALVNAPHPAASLVLINWLTTEQTQINAAQYLKFVPSRVDVAADISLLPAEERAKNVDWMSAVYKTQYISDFTQFVLQ